MIDNKNPKSGMALEGMTPLDMAKERGHMNIFMLIKSAIGHKTAEYFNWNEEIGKSSPPDRQRYNYRNICCFKNSSNVFI